MAEDVAIPLPGEIEIGMMREIHDRRLVGRGGEFQLQRIVLGQRVNRRDLQVAGKPFLAVLAQISQHQLRAVRAD